MPTILITTDLWLDVSDPLEMLREAGFEVRCASNPRLHLGLCSEQETIDELRDAHAVLANLEQYTEQVLAGLPSLRVINILGVGFDNVDIAAATAQGIVVAVTPTASHEAVAEHALALLLCVARSVVKNHRSLRAGRWEPQSSLPIRGKTLGILGLGRIGRSLARRALALKMKVIATEKAPDEAFLGKYGIELVDLDTLLRRSDYLSLNCPLTQETLGLLDKKNLAKMKPGSVLINTARGGLVVESDLMEALRSGPLRAAGLDVFEQEPINADNPLLKMDNVILSPHIATDALAIENIYTESTDNIIKLYRGEWPQGAVVNEELREGWKW